ncbi:conserved Plasmodium protein, unknown function [Plasmodium vinckei vinckei]|uniref:Uncharacterized protein n=1 Tax=Plasmodium vinckei vinckei TaxID=54757 RepID=A0A449BVT3_PLAVN|nr:conserved Plasmodium protein, unknown function [Plasmodium vinckei vinckei]KEG02512.1 hypothetical protein YYE_02340 [Plasmodium vinckei vinckei]VEV57492.1 conserved Plasmodium protein, unknown function [Plasmodium vinckei vinckei]
MSNNNEANENVKDSICESSNDNIINDENIISIFLKNVLESSFEEHIENENFLKEKNQELNDYIEQNIDENISLDDINNNHKYDDDLAFIINNNNTNKNELLLHNENKIQDAKGIEEEQKFGYNSIENTLETIHKKKNKKRRYVDINKVKFDFDEEDFDCNSDNELVKYGNKHFDKYEIEGENHVMCANAYEQNDIGNNYININNEVIRNLIEPPPIQFNKTFQKYNKEISEMFIKYKDNHDKLNIYLAAQLMCIKENNFENEHNFINTNFDNFILAKFNGTDSVDQNSKDLQELLMYLMSWYFSGFYSGRMCTLRELQKQ